MNEVSIKRRPLIERLTKNEQVREILEGMATKLPIGRKIFSIKERQGVLMFEYDGIEKNYLAQIEK